MRICIRFMDLFLSVTGIILLSPLLLIIIFCISLTSRGPVLYKQIRIGKGGKPFALWKFRTMYPNSEKKGLLTVGMNDSRITPVGRWLRRNKFDELPQLFNVLKNDLSIVGPRPEVQKYVELYSADQKKILSIKPGITDYASIKYAFENEVLAKSENPEKTYIEVIMPLKIELNMKYINKQTIWQYINIIYLTLKRII